MANPLLTSASHEAATDTVAVVFDQVMEMQGDHSVLIPSMWRLLAQATGLPVPGLMIIGVGEDPVFGDGMHFRISFVGSLAATVGYTAEASGSIWSDAGDPVNGGVADTENFLGMVLDAAEDHYLPSLYLGRMTSSNPGAASPVILNEVPEENSPFADKDGWISFEAFHLTGISLPDAVITVNGSIAFTGSAWQAGWEGYLDTLPGPGVRFNFHRLVEFDPAEVVEVVVEILPTGVGGATNTSWKFQIAEETAPIPLSASADDLRSVRVTMSEAVLSEDPIGATDALNPTNWIITGVPQLRSDRYVPARVLDIVGVTKISSTVFVLALDDYLSPDGLYVLHLENVVDLAYPIPNVVIPGDPAAVPDELVSEDPVLVGLQDGQVQFTAAGRRPRYNLFMRAATADDRRQDLSGDLRRILGVQQDTLDLGLMLADSFPEVLENPDTAPEEWLDLILADMGNPFHWLDLDVGKKRVLAVNLWFFYSLKGTAEGIEAAVRFLFDLTPVTVVPALLTTLTLGEFGGDAGVGDGSELGTEEWILGPSALYGKFSFDLEVPVVLDAETKSKVRMVVEWMKRAEEHFENFIEPAVPEDVDHWEIGMSELDVETDLH